MPSNTNPAQVSALRNSAANAGDLVMVHACDLVLGEEREIRSATGWESRYGGGGFDSSASEDIIGMTRSAARKMVAATLADAAAQADDEETACEWSDDGQD